MRIDLTARAVRDAERRAAWWRRERLGALLLFEDEPRVALDLLRVEPEAGSAYRSRDRRAYRRVLLPRSRHHVYDRVAAPDRLVVIAIWNAVGRRGPVL